jgi:O-antigen ligase
MTLQLVGLPLIFWALVAAPRAPISTAARQLLLILILMIALILIQLIPLPPAVWTRLPGRPEVARGLAMIGARAPLPWMGISLDRYATIASALWLLPAIAVLMSVLRLGSYRSAWLAWTLAATTIVSVAVGALQVAGGAEDSHWYLYEITNLGEPVGFFANTNHFATLLVSTIPFLAALYLVSSSSGRSVKKSSGLMVVLVGAMAVVLLGVAISHSIAAVALSIPVLAASLLMLMTRRRRPPFWAVPFVAVLLLGSVAAAFSAPFGNNLTTASGQKKEDSRYISFTHSLAETRIFMPVGSGVGTFQLLYPTTEDPAKVNNQFMNHVHGDYIELALETGMPGLALVLVFLVWWGRRLVRIWSAEEPDHFARAATIASAAIVAHSIVDYPLRTAAIGALFAMCCALMAEPRPKAKGGEPRAPELRARHLSAD